MADALNHNCVEISNETISLPLHPEGDTNGEYYRISKYLGDYSSIFLANPGTEEVMKQSLNNIRGRFSRPLYQMNEAAMDVDNVTELLDTGKQIWQIPFKYNAYEEDNDSEDEEDEDAPQGIRVNHGLEFFLLKEKDLLISLAKEQNRAKPERSILEKIMIQERFKEFDEEKII